MLLKQEGEALNARIRSVQERFPPSVVTEGEHRRGPSVNEINIYTFHNLKEFHVVLLHELGHVLGLPHTDERPTIMHPLIEHGSGPYHLTSSDVQAALNLCGR
jgi:predicted Zn-dependent protease